MLSIIVAGAMIASTSTALAATTKPTPKPSVKTAVKATPKPAAKVTPKSTKKPGAKKTVTKKSVTKRPAVNKTPVKKRTVYKRKVVKVSPSPSPTWPPSKKDFTNPQGGEIYYRIPNTEELLGELSATPALSEQFKSCAKFACGVVELASANGCTWWEIDSIVYGPLSATDPTPVPYGNLRTMAKGTNPRQFITVPLVSTEPLKPNVNIGGIQISCNHTPVTSATSKFPSNAYTLSTPTPSDSATPMSNTN